MNNKNEILDAWQALQDVDEERKLFKAYVDAREKYLDSLKKQIKGEISMNDLKALFNDEKDCFSKYLDHRITVKT